MTKDNLHFFLLLLSAVLLGSIIGHWLWHLISFEPEPKKLLEGSYYLDEIMNGGIVIQNIHDKPFIQKGGFEFKGKIEIIPCIFKDK
jgi:hypothetical protein